MTHRLRITRPDAAVIVCDGRVGRRASPKRARGFTLVEMLVALLLMMLIAAAVVQGLRYGQHAYQAAAKLRTLDWDVIAPRRFLHRILGSAAPPGSASFGTGAAASFEGNSDRLVFTAPAARSFGNTGSLRYEVVLVRQKGGSSLSDLVLYSKPMLSSSASTSSGDAEILVHDVRSVQWSYRDVADDTENQTEADWSGQWQSTSALPTLIRLRVAFEEGDVRRWPDFIVNLRLTQDANCVFDVVAQGCRSG
jgi:prepilin-type N-terminal cleavage/methylation domain-containing protein